MEIKNIFVIIPLLIFSLNFVSAVVVNDISQDDLFPGERGFVSVDIKNTLEEDIEDVSLNLELSEVPFISVSGSEDNVDEIRDGDIESLRFELKPSQDIGPGDYNIPYTLTYDIKNGNSSQVKTGYVGVTVGARTEIEFSTDLENNIVGETGQVTLRIINRGFGDVKFVSIRISPEGFALLESNLEYVGTISSDDFETATFDVAFNEPNANLVAVIEYKDFNNRDQTENVRIPLNVYSRDEALNLGLIQKNYTWVYVVILLVVVVGFFVYKAIRKKRKKKKVGV